MTDRCRVDPPSPFIADWLEQLPVSGAPRALDVATGRGRHAAAMAQRGYRTFAVDRQLAVLSDTVKRLGSIGVVIHAWCADLQVSGLPPSRFDLIVVTRYLQRDLCPAIAAALRPDGILLYETFTELQRQHGRGPTNPDYLLQPGELRRLFGGLDVLFYEEVDRPDAVARLVGRASSNRS